MSDLISLSSTSISTKEQEKDSKALADLKKQDFIYQFRAEPSGGVYIPLEENIKKRKSILKEGRTTESMREKQRSKKTSEILKKTEMKKDILRTRYPHREDDTIGDWDIEGQTDEVYEAVRRLEEGAEFAKALVDQSIREHTTSLTSKSDEKFTDVSRSLEMIMRTFNNFHAGWAKQTSFELEFGKRFKKSVEDTTRNMTLIFNDLSEIKKKDNLQTPEFVKYMDGMSSRLTGVSTDLASVNTSIKTGISDIMKQIKESEQMTTGKISEQATTLSSITSDINGLTIKNERLTEAIKKKASELEGMNAILLRMEKNYQDEAEKFERARRDIAMSDEIREMTEKKLAAMKKDYEAARSEVILGAQVIQNQKKDQETAAKDLNMFMERAREVLNDASDNHKRIKTLNDTFLTLQKEKNNLSASLASVRDELLKRFDDLSIKTMTASTTLPPAPPPPPGGSDDIALGFTGVKQIMENKLTEVVGEIGSISSTITGISERMVSIENLVKTNEQSIIGLSQTISSMESSLNASIAAIKDRDTQMIVEAPAVVPIDYERIKADIKAVFPKKMTINTKEISEAIVAQISPLTIDYGKIESLMDAAISRRRPDIEMSDALSSQTVLVAPDYKNLEILFEANTKAISTVFTAQLDEAIKGINKNISALSTAIARIPPPTVTIGSLNQLPLTFGANPAQPQFSYFRSFSLDWINAPGKADILGTRSFKSLARERGRVNKRHGLVQNPSNEPDPWVNPQYHQTKIRTQPVRRAIKAAVRRKKIGHSSRIDSIF